MADDSESQAGRVVVPQSPNDPDGVLEHQLEKLHEQAVAGGTAERLMEQGPLEPRLRAAQQLLNLIEQVRSAESSGIVARWQPSVDVSPLDIRQPLGHYQLIEEIGRGGMGIVYRARDSRLDRDVALKLVSPDRLQNDEWLGRFQREARAASALNHPNILTVYEIGESKGQHFIATELVAGETLRKKMLAGPLTMEESINFAGQLASALAAAHAAGIVHRDLKPDNVMIRGDGLLKILDFGLAKHLTSGWNQASDRLQNETTFVSEAGIIIGTVRYMSPEQARGLVVDARTDIFSLGVVLYEMLTGRHPFEAPTPSDVLVAILDRAPIFPAELLAGTNSELTRIMQKCLCKNREQRYLSAAELAVELSKVTQLPPNPNPDPAAPSPRDVECDRQLSAPAKGGRVENARAIPLVRYAASGDVNIAYQVLGDGPFDLVFVMGWVSHLEWFWKEPSFAAFLQRLATFSRVILFDKRGTGLSDKVPVDQLPTLEQRMDDVRAVMDAVGSERAVLCGISEGGPLCTLFAATYPEKTIALTMIGCYARRLWAPDYPWGPTEEHRQHFLDEIRRNWGGPVGIEDRAPSRAEDPDFRDWWATYLRMGASPGAALALTNMNAQIDIRPILPTIQVPTLVIHRTEDHCLGVEEGRFLADQIPGSKWVELPGADHLPFVGDQEAILNEIEVFLTGVRQPTSVDRVLATVLHVTIEADGAALRDTQDGSTTLTQKFSAHITREVDLFRGRIIRLDPNRAIAIFDGPARAVRAAIAINDSARRLTVGIRTGVHTGECDILQNVPTGPTVERTRQISQRGAIGDVLVSATVRDLVVGSGLAFVDHSTLDINDGPLVLYQVDLLLVA